MPSSHNYLFVSDFHLSEGRNPDSGHWSRNEDFFQDAAFARMLAHHVGLSQRPSAADATRKPWQLILNGDIFDFLQVTSLPPEGAELERVCGVARYADLSGNKRGYGLGTRPSETVWKLNQIAAGHPIFFQALAWFLAHERHQIIWLKGNHDIEIHWPQVQQRVRQHLVSAYDDWFQQAIQSDGEAPLLPHHEGLLSQLNLEEVQTAVQFKPSFHYQPGLFYVDHGCQYEPANAFQDFENPILPHDPEQIELPSGSLFVRYFFNKVEEIHPFADNMKPMTRYVTWLITNAPSAFIVFLIDLLPRYLLALWKTKKKQAQDVWRQMRGQTRPPVKQSQVAQELWEDVLAIQTQIQARLRRSSRLAGIATAASLLFFLGVIGFLLVAARYFVLSNWGLTAVYLITALFSATIASYLMRVPDRVVDYPYLLWAERAIAAMMQRRRDNGALPVRCLIFGHNHVAGLEKVVQAGETPLWYINTGAWIPVFRQEDRLLRGDDQLTFLRLIPDKPGASANIPELLEWLPDADQPVPVKVFAQKQE